MSRFKEAMSILFGKKPSNTRYADMLNGYTPIFTQFGQNIYASDVVQQALNCIVSEMKKLNPMHVRTNGMDETPVTGSSLQSVLENPNELMTKSEFIEKIMWNLLFTITPLLYRPIMFGMTKIQKLKKEYIRLFILFSLCRWISFKTHLIPYISKCGLQIITK